MPFRKYTLSLNTRIVAALMVMLVIIVGFIALYLPYSANQLRRVVAHMEARVIVQDFADHGNVNALQKSYRGDALSYTLYSEQGEVLQVSDNLSSAKMLRPQVISDQKWWPTFDSVGFSINVPVHLENNQILMVAKRDSTSRSYIEEVFTSLITKVLGLAVPLLLLSSITMWLLLRWTLAPVKKAADLASEIRQDNLRYLDTTNIPREIIPLAKATNDVVRHLSSAYLSNQQFTADAAHQLRTPLTVLNLELENHSHKASFERANQALAQIKSLVNQLLQLASLEADQLSLSTRLQRFDICRLWREAVATHFLLFNAQNRALVIRCPDSELLCNIQPELLRRAFNNLLENALQHGHGKTQVTIFEEQDRIIMQVSDQGDAPDISIQNQLFERFIKANEASTGTGLGLAIVSKTLESLGGSITFSTAKNTTFELVLMKAQ